MSSTPPRRHSPAVYRRRRLVLLFALLLIVAGVVLAIVRPWESKADPAATSAPTAAATDDASQLAPTPDASATSPNLSDSSKQLPTEGDPDAAIEPCTSETVTVTARSDKQSYGAGENPNLSIVLKNVSGADCTIDAGTAAQVFEVASGKDVYWRSTDCQKDPTNQVVTIKAGQEVPSAQPLVWDRTRSSADTCDTADRAAAPAGGASYHLTVSIGGIASTESAQFMLQ